ncbi:MAG: bifunctional diaminohydroxyphosphoribosylaminopyrimidine deaminase/5-amino-6-(5-phosphoribosylamino)uracil reductase RibD, partial [Acidimicrobiales bacterium]
MVSDAGYMREAIAAAEIVRRSVVPNPWVGAVVVSGDSVCVGATEPPGGRHGERVALDEAGASASGATLYSTLEPCCHTGRTGPCTDAIIAAGVVRVVVGVEDPDEHVAGRGITQLKEAGIAVDAGVLHDEITEQLRAYLHHRRTGRPYVTLKLAATLDGRTAAPDGSSQWITGEAARADVHRLRATCDGILVGAGTVRADDPALTVRHVEGQDPRRFVLGEIPEGAKILPAVS